MPIHLNLLAEAQAAEDLRRRDPVKRAMWIAGLLIALMLVWSSGLYVQAAMARRTLNRVEGEITVRTNDYQQVLDFQKKTTDIETKLAALVQLATNRFLNGTMLNALQHSTIPAVQMTRLRVDQKYTATEATKPKHEGTRTIPGKPATATEKITVVIEAKDYSSNPGDQVNHFKEAIADNPYFLHALASTNDVRLTYLSQPQTPPDGKPFVQFTLECRYPEKTR
jgi:hypothetical protein